jgi:N6-adenosine-specific RNA methylase IME4
MVARKAAASGAPAAQPKAEDDSCVIREQSPRPAPKTTQVRRNVEQHIAAVGDVGDDHGGGQHGGGRGDDDRGSDDHPPALPAAPAAVVTPTRRLDEIIVGDRHRRDLGDIDHLARSIAEVGLLHPIVIDAHGRLIAGVRRLNAVRQNGWTEVPVRVVDLNEIVLGEFHENAQRKDFLPSEIDAIRRAPIERAKAKAREQAGRPPGGKFPQGTAGKTRDKIGAFAGVSGRTIEKIAAVVEAAKAEPEKFGKLLADMDRTGRVNGVFKRLKVIKQAAIIRAEPPPLPGNGPYRVAAVDFPWAYEIRQDDPSHRAARPYPTMNINQILEFGREKLRTLTHDDSVLALWSTNFHLIRYAAPILDAAGFSERTILTWVKTNNFGTGDILRSQTEHCVLAVRGKPTVTLTNESTVLFAPARGHSVKPVEFYDLVEGLCPAPRYADLFSRYRHNDRWDCHGDEAPPGEPTPPPPAASEPQPAPADPRPPAGGDDVPVDRRRAAE